MVFSVFYVSSLVRYPSFPLLPVFPVQASPGFLIVSLVPGFSRDL